MRKRRFLASFLVLPLLAASALPAAASSHTTPPSVQVILDGQPLSLNPAPIIVDDRTLVPLRGVLEAMGATVNWNGETRTVVAQKGDHYARLRIDRRLGCLEVSCLNAVTLDVPAQLRQDRTYVPLRFLAQAMGAEVTWDASRRAVMIETSRPAVPQPAPVRLLSPSAGHFINGPVSLQAQGLSGNHVQFYLIDPETGSGRMIGAGSDPNATYTFVPDPANAGRRLIVAAIRDGAGAMRYSDPVPVWVWPDFQMRVTGAEPNGLVDGPITFGSEVGFVATQVTFTLRDPATGAAETLGTVGPGDTVTWFPQIGHNGIKQIGITAEDRNGRTYHSTPVTVRVQSGYRQFVSGVREGAVLTSGTVTLRPSMNYTAESVQYLLNDRHLGWGHSFTWRYGPEMNGTHQLKIRLIARDGSTHVTPPVNFEVRYSKQVWPTGIGPNQVVTGAVSLNASSNVGISSYEYHLADERGNSVELLGRATAGQAFSWTPAQRHAGDRRLLVIGQESGGGSIRSELIPFKVYLGTVFGPRPLVPRSEFLALSSRLSVPAYHQTGMSAALKVAQSILETGWGQSTPVDKYTGQFSNNPFGIKGRGPAGSVISNTWEEYNGVAYRIDDYFRAYNTIEEAWQDHADLLLTRSWYAPYRAVMTEPVLGAWALRRSGYATDSQYPVKLINIMKQNDLFKLDEFEF